MMIGFLLKIFGFLISSDFDISQFSTVLLKELLNNNALETHSTAVACIYYSPYGRLCICLQ